MPEFLYRDLYDEKHRMRGIHGLGKDGSEFVQKGIREPLLCDSCERLINDNYEKPFLSEWVDAAPLPAHWPTDELIWLRVTYETFKLFHLSVLFRAAVSSNPMFEEVKLGPHKDKIRLMLLNRDPGRESEYQIGACAVIHHQTREVVQLVTRFQAGRIEGGRCYGMIYGGAQWWVAVGHRPNPAFKDGSLRANGQIPVAPIKWNELLPVQQAHFALNRANA